MVGHAVHFFPDLVELREIVLAERDISILRHREFPTRRTAQQRAARARKILEHFFLPRI